MLRLLAALTLSFAAAQDPPGKVEPSTPPPDLVVAESQVGVTITTDDASIERRLRRVLSATGYFEHVELHANDGVVILTGSVVDPAAKEWVGVLVAKTEGVVAVLNRLSPQDSPFLDLAPALAELRATWRAFVGVLPRLAIALLVLVGMGFSVGLARRLLARPLQRRVASELLRAVIDKSLLAALSLLVVYVFLRISGLTQVAVTVVGGTGVLGIVLGFAFRDIAENFLASVLISWQKPFRYGDTIEVDGNRGVVQRVTPRGTILMDFEGNYIQIANSQIYKSTIKNFTANPKVRQEFAVGIGYDTGLVHAQSTIMRVLEEHSAVLDDPQPMVLVEELGSATVSLRAYFWIDGTKHSYLKVRSALVRLTLAALQQAGVSMPDDAREVIFPRGVPVTLRRDDEPREREPAAQALPTKPPPADEHGAGQEVTAAEGGLSSETSEVNEQVRASRRPEEGRDVMAPRSDADPDAVVPREGHGPA
jgi:small conductance mechanosensitive channel